MVYLRREAVLAVICFLCFQKIVSVAGHRSVLHHLSAKRVKQNKAHCKYFCHFYHKVVGLNSQKKTTKKELNLLKGTDKYQNLKYMKIKSISVSVSTVYSFSDIFNMYLE